MATTEQTILEKLRQAREAYSSQEYDKAIEMYRWVSDQIKDDKTNLPIIYVELGWSYYNANDFKNCILYLKKALSGDTLTVQQRFDCLKLIGFSYKSSGDISNSLQYLGRAVDEEIPESQKRYAYFEIGKIHFTSGAIHKSKPYLKKAEAYFTWNESMYFQAISYYLGFVAYYEKQYQLAQRYFSKIIEKIANDKGKAAGYFGLAHLFYVEKNYAKLIEVCRKILKLDNDFYDKETIEFFLSKSFLELGQNSDFIKHFSNLRNKYPKGRYQSHYPLFEKKLPRTQNSSSK